MINNQERRQAAYHWGRRCEDEAAEWLARQPGTKILDRNFRCRTGELDLILEEIINGRTELVFVEVRGRNDARLCGAIESVTFPKRRRLELAAQRYLLQYRGPARSLRFDILANDGGRWVRLKNAW